MSATWRRWADVPPTSAWTPADPHSFKLPEARHLLRRAAFGSAPGEAEALVERGLEQAVAKLVTGDVQQIREREETFERLGKSAAEGEAIPPVRRWWLYQMCHSGHPLREKMTLFWHWHFATGADKVASPARMFRQNCTFRRHALGKFGPMLLDVARDPAMLVWLDGNSNTKAHANENFAREVMELFSLGVGRYTEKDVREAARAFTGFHLDEAADEFRFNADEHDAGEKTVLGRAGPLGGDEVLRHLLTQPACALFVAGKVARYLLSDEAIPESVIEPLAAGFRKSDYSIEALVGTILKSKLFYASVARRARVKTPVEFVLGAARSLFGDVVDFSNLSDPMAAMGMALFAPPDVKGWRGGRAWLSHAALVERLSLAEKLAMGFSTDKAYLYSLSSRMPIAPQVMPPPLPPNLQSATTDAARGRLENEAATATAPSFPLASALEFDGETLPTPRAKAPYRETLGKPSEKRVQAMIVQPQFPMFDVLNGVTLNTIAEATFWLDAMAERLFDGPLPSVARQKLIAHVAEADGHPPWIGQRCREALHAMLSMPEYQLN